MWRAAPVEDELVRGVAGCDSGVPDTGEEARLPRHTEGGHLAAAGSHVGSWAVAKLPKTRQLQLVSPQQQPLTVSS